MPHNNNEFVSGVKMSGRISSVEVRKNSDDRVSPILESTIEEVLVLIRAMFPVSTVRAHAREKRARELVQRALLTLDNVFTQSAAIESVGSFKIPAAIMEADEELFRTCDRSIIESARVRQAAL